jgi:hypothetical protein
LSLYLTHDVGREASLVKILDGLWDVPALNRDTVKCSELINFSLGPSGNVRILLVE